MFEGVILYFLLFLSEEECQENCLKIKLWGSCSSLLRVGSFTSLKCRKGVWFCTRRERLVLFFFFFFPCPVRLLAPWDWGVDCFGLIFVAQRTEVAILTRLKHPCNANTYRRISLGHLAVTSVVFQTSLMPSLSLPSLPSPPLDDTRKKNIVMHSGLQGPTWQ